jgi:hypothetical protein
MKRDIKTFRAVCRRYHMTSEQIYDFSDYVHELKDAGFGGTGTRGDFTFEELADLAEAFLDLKGENHGT